MDQKELKFGEGLLEPTLSLEKKITLRNYRPKTHDFKEGEHIVGCFVEGLDIVLRITADTEVTTFGRLSDEVAQQDGFIDAKDAFLGMGKYYKDLTLDTSCAIIRFEIPRIADTPSVRLSTKGRY